MRRVDNELTGFESDSRARRLGWQFGGGYGSFARISGTGADDAAVADKEGFFCVTLVQSLTV